MKQLTNFDRNVILIVGIEPPNILDVAWPQIHLLLLIKVHMYFSMHGWYFNIPPEAKFFLFI